MLCSEHTPGLALRFQTLSQMQGQHFCSQRDARSIALQELLRMSRLPPRRTGTSRVQLSLQKERDLA